MKSTKVTKSFRLSPLSISTLSKLSSIYGKSQTEVLEDSLFLAFILSFNDGVLDYSKYTGEELRHIFLESRI